MDTEKMFELADRLRALRDEKAEAEQHLKEIKAEMDEVDYRLSELMAESETQNFTRAGTMFCLTTKTHASAVAGRKEELFSALRAGGFGDLVYETVNANSLSAFVKEQVAENGDTLFLTRRERLYMRAAQPLLLTRCRRATACGPLQKSASETAPGTMRSRN